MFYRVSVATVYSGFYETATLFLTKTTKACHFSNGFKMDSNKAIFRGTFYYFLDYVILKWRVISLVIDPTKPNHVE